MFEYESSKTIQVQNDSKATDTLETEADFSRDARAIRERALKKVEEAIKGKNKTSGDGNIYRGIHNYTNYKAGFRREQTVAAEKAGGAHGPLVYQIFVRITKKQATVVTVTLVNLFMTEGIISLAAWLADGKRVG